MNQTAADGTTIAPGIDRVTDFVVGVDHLEFSGIDSLYGLAFAPVGADTVITYAQADGAITLTEFDLDELLACAL